MWWGSCCTWTARTPQTHELVHPSLSSLLWAALGLGLVLGPLRGGPVWNAQEERGPGRHCHGPGSCLLTLGTGWLHCSCTCRVRKGHGHRPLEGPHCNRKTLTSGSCRRRSHSSDTERQEETGPVTQGQLKTVEKHEFLPCLKYCKLPKITSQKT